MFQIHPTLLRDCQLICDLSLSSLLLMNDRNYPWVIQVPRVADVTEIIDLEERQQQQLWAESAQLSRCLKRLYHPHKLNIAALGNMVPQLHVHHIVRYRSDIAWPHPVWGREAPNYYPKSELDDTIAMIREGLACTPMA